jgi:hypothetical protein
MSNIGLLAAVAKGLGHLSQLVIYVGGDSFINKSLNTHSDIR